ncbi:MAG: ArsA family ATPase [Acidimicrobiales bacterium]
MAGDPKVIFVTGKGGVGKTTVTRLLTALGEAAGLRCAAVHLGEFTGIEISSEDDLVLDKVSDVEPEASTKEPVSQSPTAQNREIRIDPADALIDYLNDHGFGKLASRLIATGVVGVIATAIPGIKDLLLLGKIKQLEQSNDYDLLVVDAPATGHTLSFLTSPEGLRDIAKVGPLRKQSEDVLAMLADESRSGCVIVTIAEESPIDEALESVTVLGERTRIHVTSIVINQVLAPLSSNHDAPERETIEPETSDPVDLAWRFRRNLQERQTEQLLRLKETYCGTTVALPLLPLTTVHSSLVDQLLEQLEAQMDLEVES